MNKNRTKTWCQQWILRFARRLYGSVRTLWQWIEVDTMATVRTDEQGPTRALDHWRLRRWVLARCNVLFTAIFLLIGVFYAWILLFSLFLAGYKSLLPARKEEGVILGGRDTTALLWDHPGILLVYLSRVHNRLVSLGLCGFIFYCMSVMSTQTTTSA